MRDDELIAEHLAGSEGAFAQLVECHLGVVYRLTLRILRTSTEAEDAVQETFLKVWRNLGQFRQGENFCPWLLQIARNTAIDMLRKRRETSFSELQSNAEEDAVYSPPDTSPSPEEMAARSHDADEVQRLLRALPDEDQEILLLHYQEDLPFREIAEIIGKPLDTVKSRARRALQTMKKHLAAPKQGPATYI